MNLRILIYSLLAAFFMPVSTYAYDFDVDGIYYGINDDGTSVNVGIFI